jgi:hypothetical protein
MPLGPWITTLDEVGDPYDLTGLIFYRLLGPGEAE